MPRRKQESDIPVLPARLIRECPANPRAGDRVGESTRRMIDNEEATATVVRNGEAVKVGKDKRRLRPLGRKGGGR